MPCLYPSQSECWWVGAQFILFVYIQLLILHEQEMSQSLNTEYSCHIERITNVKKTKTKKSRIKYGNSKYSTSHTNNKETPTCFTYDQCSRRGISLTNLVEVHQTTWQQQQHGHRFLIDSEWVTFKFDSTISSQMAPIPNFNERMYWSHMCYRVFLTGQIRTFEIVLKKAYFNLVFHTWNA